MIYFEKLSKVIKKAPKEWKIREVHLWLQFIDLPSLIQDFGYLYCFINKNQIIREFFYRWFMYISY